MDISSETVKNKLYDNLGDAEAFNREIIRHWANKNSGPYQIKVFKAFTVRLYLNLRPKIFHVSTRSAVELTVYLKDE